ncbi:MAG: pepsin-like aspartyl protease [archaeon]|nr:pepsin-like aspartyl protease [archaeon]
MNLRFNCKHQQIAEGVWVKESIIPVTLIGNSGVRLNITAILDSGSDFILLPLEVAEALNLAFNIDTPDLAKTYTGASFSTTKSMVKIEIKKGREEIKLQCKCAVILEKEKQHEHIIFGSSFFEQLKIVFDYPNNKFEIRSATKRS